MSATNTRAGDKAAVIAPVAGHWWLFLLRGIAGILFGLIAFVLPAMALLTLVFLFGFYAISDGVFNLVAAFRRGPGPRGAGAPRWALFLRGVLGLIAGVTALILPDITALALLYIIAAWALVTGVFDIAAAISLRREISNEWLLVLSGVLSVLVGILLFLFPGPGALAMVIWIGAWALVLGVLLVVLAFRLRKVARAAAGHVHEMGRVAPSH